MTVHKRTQGERRAYVQGYEAALAEAEKHGVKMATEFHRLMSEAEDIVTGAGEIDPLEAEIRKWQSELSLRIDKSGKDSAATLYAQGVLKGLRWKP